jgi:hypothetical protein
MVCYRHVIVNALHKGDDDDDNNDNNNNLMAAYGYQKWDVVGRNELGSVDLNKKKE